RNKILTPIRIKLTTFEKWLIMFIIIIHNELAIHKMKLNTSSYSLFHSSPAFPEFSPS
ncbi:hypothetical protein L9F63_027688, partial [Diploptera punctata]